ncbi:DUF87 domain-containing protein [Halonotius terrestris]|uniref:DUF87 domain-containing protein n=1 Tax=Halonotius terrestris TaxID=2487750 RepID=A0A8J8PB11_9EURY|nr:ATP-binding protein [Halonotius terrestris]TQQ82991.1 DUF87 domain-containing protein [Halonotius terrestris]
MKPVWMPGDLEVPMRLFGRIKAKDLARISLPLVPGVLTQNLVGIAAGVLISLVWFFWKPYGRPLDGHVFHTARWLIGKRQLEKKADSSDSLTGEVEENAFRTGEGGLGTVIRIEPTNLDLKTGAEQGAVHNLYQEFIETVNYPVQIHSRQKRLDLDKYLDHLESCESSSELLKTDYVEFCEEFENQELTLTQHYIVVHVEQDGLSFLQEKYSEYLGDGVKSENDEALRSELDSRCREVLEALNTSDLNAERLTDTQLTQFTSAEKHTTPNPSPQWTTQGGQYRKTIQLDEYPSKIDLAWPVQLLRIRGMVDTVQVIEPCNTSKAVKKLNRVAEKLNAEIDSLLAGGHRGTNKLESLLEDANQFLNLLAEKEAHPVEYSAYLTVHHPKKERAGQTFEKVCNRLDTLRFEYSQPVLRTDQAYKTSSPLYRNPLNHSLLVPSSSAAAGFPFATQNTEDTGIIYGADTYSGNPVLLNRFNWSSHSMARMGAVGSGKSYAAKIELLRSALIYQDLKIIVVDPKQEYKHLIQSLGGNVETLEETTDYSLDNQATCLSVSERGQSENVELLTDAVEQVYSSVSQDQERTLVLVDEARILLNDEDGRRVLNQFVLEGRDTNTAITLITQNASHFTHSREGREILDNMPGKIFMRHDRVPESVVDYFNLSQREKQELYELRTGTESPYSEALLHVSGRIKTRLRVESTPQEHAVIQGGEQA